MGVLVTASAGAQSNAVAVENGRLSVAGTIRGTLSNNGRLAPGGSPGALTVEGDFAQPAGGVLEIEMIGPEPGTGHDVLTVTGAATLGGTLEIVRDPAFAPVLGAEFTVAEWGSREGQFADVAGNAIPGGRAFEARAGDGSLVLAVVATVPPSLTLATGPAAPAASTTAAPGDSGIPVLQAAVSAAATGDHAVVGALTLQASGTGNDAADVARVTVYVDTDEDGAVGPGEPLVAEGSFEADDGNLTLTLAAPLVIPAGNTATLLVAYDLEGGIAATAARLPAPWLAILPCALLGWVGVRGRRVRRLLLLFVVAAMLGGCGGSGGGGSGGGSGGDDTPQPPVSPTYRVAIVELQSKGETSDLDAEIAGLPITGTQLTVTS